MHRLYFIGLFVAMSGACLAVVATFLKTEPRQPIILAPGPSGNEPFQPVALYPHSGVSMAGQDIASAYTNNSDDEIHYVVMDHGQWKLVGSEKMMHELIK